jgi:hypothetical protein
MNESAVIAHDLRLNLNRVLNESELGAKDRHLARLASIVGCKRSRLARVFLKEAR